MTRIHANSPQGPERWETETDDEEEVGTDQVEELVPDIKVDISKFLQDKEDQPSEVIAHADNQEMGKSSAFSQRSHI